MKTLKTLSILFIVSLLTLVSCKKEDDEESNTDTESLSGPLTAKIDGEDFSACGMECIDVDVYDDTLVYVTGFNLKGELLVLGIVVSAKPGIYDLSEDADDEYYAVYSNSDDLHFTTDDFDGNDVEGVINIEDVSFDESNNLKRLKGTFNFTGYDEINVSLKKVITEGKVDLMFD